MLKWTKEILLILAKKVNPKQAFLLLGMIIFFTGSYFVLDRLLDYREAVNLDKPKLVIERPESSVPEYVKYVDKTLFEIKADNINKQEN